MRYFTVVALALAVACGGSDPSGPHPQLAVTIDIIGGDKQVASVGAELASAVTAKVTDDKTTLPVKGVLVNWVVVTGGGHVFAGTALTDSLGTARERWTLGPALGVQTLEARAVDDKGNAVTYTRVTATASAGIAYSFDISSLSNVLHVGDTARVYYVYRDQYANPTRTCADQGAPSRVTWTSLDSSRAVPTGEMLGDSATGYYTRVIGKAVGLVSVQATATQNGKDPGCVSELAGPASVNGSVQFNVQ